MGTPAYRAFRRGFLEYSWRDGPDVRTLDALTPAERRSAEQELLDRLDENADWMAAMDGLTHLRSSAAVGPLRAIMRTGRDRRAVRAAIALWQIGEDEEAFGTLRRVVEHRPLLRDWARVDAAAILRGIDRPAALVTLIDALDDRDDIVAANAASAMRDRLGLAGEAEAVAHGRMTVAQFQAAARTVLARFGGVPDPAVAPPPSKVVSVPWGLAPATAIRTVLPLEIHDVRYDDPVLRLSGESRSDGSLSGTRWWLTLSCAWRVTEPGREYSWESGTVAADVRGLVNRRIVAVSFDDDVTVDPVFALDGGLTLAVRADTDAAPWSMTVPGATITGRRGRGPVSGTGPYRRFRHYVLDHPPPEGPDLRLLDDLGPADRQRAERELLARVGDSTAAIRALAHLRSAAAVAPLRAELRSRPTGDRAVHAAVALWDIAEDEEAFRLLCRTVQRRPLLRQVQDRRADAAVALGRIARPEALVVLIGALDDGDAAVVGHARTAVAARLRLDLELDAWRAGYLTAAEFRAAAWAAFSAGEGADSS